MPHDYKAAMKIIAEHNVDLPELLRRTPSGSAIRSTNWPGSDRTGCETGMPAAAASRVIASLTRARFACVCVCEF